MWTPLALVVLQGAAAADNDAWRAKVKPAVERAANDGSPAAYREALEVAWRADDWQAAETLAADARSKHPRDASLAGFVARALWRAGRVAEAEAAAASIDPNSAGALELRTLISIEHARGRGDVAGTLADRLARAEPRGPEDDYAILMTRIARKQMTGAADLARRVLRTASADHGYPENHMVEVLQGLPQFLEFVGDRPLNRIAQHGSAPMTALVMFGLPSAEVLINGRGPYRMVIDTGGSILLSLDQAVADELGLKSIAPATVRGVSGKEETGQLLLDRVQIGSIVCENVVSRSFDVRSAVMNAADGIIGTGLFADGRVTFDFANEQMAVSASREGGAPGERCDIRIVGDSKILARVQIQDRPGLALFDSGADAIAVSPLRLAAWFPNEPLTRVETGLGIGVGGDATPEIALGPGVKLNFGGREFPRYGGIGLDVMDTLLSPVLGVQLDILVGMPMFREMRTWTVDLPRAQMWVEWLRRGG